MPKTPTPKWAIVGTWRRYRLFPTKKDAEARLREWVEEQRKAGRAISGSLGAGYRATTASWSFGTAMQAAQQGERPVGVLSARIIKLADHPLCYIGVVESDVERLRAMEEAENPAFERYSTAAKAMSERWEEDEAF